MNIILTGSSSGFGMITATTLAKQGHNIFATMRNVTTANAGVAEKLMVWAKENSANIHVVELDVTSDSSVQEAMEKIAELTNGKIDVLINNAGSAYIGLNETLSAAQTNQMFQINVIGVDRMIKAVLPYMHQQKNGLLITISSVASRMQIPIMGAYGATKSAVDALSVSYYYELQSSGIDVAIIQPGAYPSTDIVTKQVTPAKPSAEAFYGSDMHTYKASVIKHFSQDDSNPDPAEVAEMIAYLINMPTGERPLWSIVRGGPIESAVEHINESIQQLVDGLLRPLYA